MMKRKRTVLGIIIGIVTLLLIMGCFAWFSTTRQINSLTYVGKPSKLTISEGNRTDTTVINMGEIDITNKKGTHDFVFSVHGNIENENWNYDIQLIHTTNLPFTYTIHHAYIDDKGSISYYNVDTQETINFSKGKELIGAYINPNKGEEGYTDTNAYPANSSAQVHTDAYPKYWLNTTPIKPSKVKANKQFRDYYVLTVSWDKDENINNEDYKQNIDKETEMVYLLAEGALKED